MIPMTTRSTSHVAITVCVSMGNLLFLEAARARQSTLCEILASADGSRQALRGHFR